MVWLAFASLAVWICLIFARGGFWLAREREAGALAPPSWPDVVAVVSARDVADAIAATVSSLLTQGYLGRFRVGLIDDESADDTVAIAHRGRRVARVDCRSSAGARASGAWIDDRALASTLRRIAPSSVQPAWRPPMKALILKAFGQPLALEQLPDPIAGPGQAVVEVAAARVLPYMREVVSGERRYPLELPAVPGAGAVGRICALGPDATRLKVGDWVLCDPTLRSRDDAITPDIALQGLASRGPGGETLQRLYRNGSFATRMLAPLENLHPLGEIEPENAPRWCALGTLLVPYGGLLAADFRPGETLAVLGATGNFGGAAVLLALSLGASVVLALGRNRDALTALERRFGARVRGVALSGEETRDIEQMKRAARGPIDVVLDILPPEASAAATRAAILSLREFGRAVLMGGIGARGEDISVPYNWLMRNSVTVRGQWMYPRAANASLISLARSGQIDLSIFEVAAFPLEQIKAALDHAAAVRGAFKTTVLTP